MLNKSYLIALDLDGTLLNDQKKISFLTRRYLRSLVKKGHKVIIASGRAPRSINKFVKYIGLKDLSVGYNGGIIFEYLNDKCVGDCVTLSQEALKNIYAKHINKELTNVFCENIKSVWIDKEDDLLFCFYQTEDLKINRGPIDKILDEDPAVFVAHTIELSEKEKSKLKKDIEETHKDIKVRFFTDAPYLELYKENISKASAIKVLAKKYGIPEDHIIVFGDSYNDIEMLEAFKHSFLMVNNAHKFRKHASYVTIKDNNHSGVKHSLKQFFKNNK